MDSVAHGAVRLKRTSFESKKNPPQFPAGDFLTNELERKPSLTLECPASGLRCDLTKTITEAIRIGQACRIAGRRMIHDVGRIDSDLDRLRFREPESLADAGIECPSGYGMHGESSQIPLMAGQCLLKQRQNGSAADAYYRASGSRWNYFTQPS
jgi:hypothetical protein